LVAAKQRRAFYYLGATEGLSLLNFEKDQWVTQPVPEVNMERVPSIYEEEDGTLWLGSLNGSVARITNFFSEDVSVDYFGEEEGLPGHLASIKEIAGHVVVSTRSGVYRYTEEN